MSETLYVRIYLRKNSGKRLKLHFYDPISKKKPSLKDIVQAQKEGHILNFDFTESVDAQRAKEFLVSLLRQSENMDLDDTVFLNNVIRQGGFIDYIKQLEKGIALQ